MLHKLICATILFNTVYHCKVVQYLMPAFFPIIRNKLILLAYIREGGGGGGNYSLRRPMKGMCHQTGQSFWKASKTGYVHQLKSLPKMG